MIILGIETSCDETAAAIVEDGTKLISSALASSMKMHEKYGGIIPDKAAREQLKSVIPVIQESLSVVQPELSPHIIDAIAVTVGPGLIGSLLVGVETAKALALAWKKPLIPVNHLVGHFYANWITSSLEPLTYQLPTSTPQFPSLALLVSGGHTELVLMKDHGDFQVLGTTLDDAVGECFDKCGRVLRLPYPYGPLVEKEAEKINPRTKNQESRVSCVLPRPMLDKNNYNFSFSGLKTAFISEFKKFSNSSFSSSLVTSSLAYELQEAITDVLVSKTLKAVEEFSPKSLLLAGGVAANIRLREKILLTTSRYLPTTRVHTPPLKLCTDNAVTIASAAFFNQKIRLTSQVSANPGLDVTDN
jgi:N6-L-threonylcarbamoyladenine synthase